MTDTTTQDLKDAENALRDLIYAKLISTFGKDWPKECSVTQERIKVWEKRKEEERKKISAIDERLLYYADFHDLQTILHKNWDSMFREIFIDKKRLEAYLSILEDYRNPEAHRRELFPHQKQLVSGASGEIRSLIVRWRSKKEGADDFFPKIEFVRDSLGNIGSNPEHYTNPKTIHVGDVLEFIVTATDPDDGKILYGLYKGAYTHWQEENVIRIQLTEKHISKCWNLLIVIKGDKDYHAYKDHDDGASFAYCVLPKNTTTSDSV